jgi:hypothetical protein
MIGIRPIRFEPVPSWCTGGFSRNETERRRIRPPFEFVSTNFVFSSVLREPARKGVPLSHGMSLELRCHSVSVSVFARSRRWRCPLRTAEQARASLFFQATKSQRWMPWRQEPMKDVSDCEKLRGTVY